MKKITHPSGKLITFNSQWHQYSMEGCGTLKSVSKVLDRHFPFDEARVSSVVSAKTGQTPAEVSAGWKRQAVLGKNIHAFIEAKLRNEPPPVVPAAELHGEEAKYMPVAQVAVDTVSKLYETVAIEQVIASPMLGLAGTIDFLGRNKRTGAILVGDWKTSGSITSSFRFGSFETPAIGMLSHLPNAKLYRYALQIMIYGFMLRLEGYDSVFGPEILSKPIEYGIIQMSKTDTGDVDLEFKKVCESTILPIEGELGVDELLRAVIRGGM
jgi:hypothetical protein